MKRTINYFVLRAVSAILLGVLLIWIPKSIIFYIVIAIGIFFILPGVISLIGYFTSEKEKQQDMPFLFTAIGSLLFGILLVSMPGFFVTVLMYLLGLIILLGAIEQIVTLIRTRKTANVPLGFYVIPVLILIAGILVLLNPFKTAETLFILIGVTCVVYGAMEFVNWLKFRRKTGEQTPLADCVQ
jgi:uncharacterized membrane protein HdeD (DUF308 family)